MDIIKCSSSNDAASSLRKAPLTFPNKVHLKAHVVEERTTEHAVEADVDMDLSEVYFLIMHFLSAGPCQRTCEQFRNELLEHQLLPRRYHAWFSRTAVHSGDDDDNGVSFPLDYASLVKRYPHIGKGHLVKLLKQLIQSTASTLHGKIGRNSPTAADVPTLLGTGSFSLLHSDKIMGSKQVKHVPAHMRWPHTQVDQVRGLSLREIGGGFIKHHRAPSIRSACYAIAKPSTMVQKMETTKRLRGHRDAVYCAIFDRSGRYVITGSDDRLVKIWSMETAFCLTSCRGHEGDITDLAVSSNNAVVASAANDFVIRVWSLPDGLPISVLQGHTAAVTAIAFSPRPSFPYNLLSSSDDGTCRIWDARISQGPLQVYVPKPSDAVTGRSNGMSSYGTSSSIAPQSRQILCCAYNANGTVFVTGSSDTFARVWNACKTNTDNSGEPIHEMDILSGHENDVNYVQFSGCAMVSRSPTPDTVNENVPKFKNSWFCHDNIVTCSRDGSAIIWVPRSRKYHGKAGRWMRAYHLKVPPPPLPPQPPRGGPRQRLLPTPRGVNMIVWSLDNRFVLAAIMDCRICVWNAIDGSLVHSLTGHRESSYVLDVHPFNPRIAMSAGYDGLTIVWDIWEGTPIRIFEVGGYKLVDGKFSPDGTSIVLSDDVGQIYFLNTGQGESHKDAKYDQFFLGDYRPLVRYSNGNVIDQETQLPPHKRNLQDLLCDSSMFPYPEPYQTMYQQRRLGSLRKEWRPSSIKFATGLDISLGQDYQMPPLADMEIMHEPLPEFVDAIYLEPDNEVLSDDNDSEYNVPEEICSEGEQRDISGSSFSNPECSTEDSDDEHSNKEDSLRRSRRNHSTKVEPMTSSGRLLKKRNLDERAGTTSRSNRKKRLRSVHSASKRKSSKAVTLRPQRVAARNAINMLSQISGTSSGEDEDDSEDSSSDSESVMHDSNIQCTGTDKKMQNNQQMSHNKVNSTKLPELPGSQPNPGKRSALVIKFSLGNSKKSVPPEECIGPSSRSQENSDQKRTGISSKDPGSSFADAINVEYSKSCDRSDPINTVAPEKDVDLLLASADEEEKIGWGESKACTSKQLKSSNEIPIHEITGTGDMSETEAIEELDAGKNKEPPFPDDAHKCTSHETLEPDVHQLKGSTSTALSNGDLNLPGPDNLRVDNSLGRDGGVIGTNPAYESEGNPPLKPTKIRIKIKSPSKLKSVHAVENPNTSSDVHSLQLLHPEADNVQKSGKSYKVRTDSEDMDDGNSFDSEMGFPETETSPDVIQRTRSMKTKAASRESGAGSRSVKVRVGHKSARTSKNSENISVEEYDQDTSDEWPANSKTTVRSGSSRSARVVYYDSKSNKSSQRKSNHPPTNYSSQRKSNHTPKKTSWLMLSEIEEGYRYIPQLGDRVVYLIQGHTKFLKTNTGGSSELPHKLFEGKTLGAVEICKVEEIKYIVLSGSGDSGCRITLKFDDPTSSVFNESFQLTLPELIDFPDFVVEKTLYDAARERQWTEGDKCMVWWKSPGEEGGKWWEGEISSSKPQSPDFPDSPWERYLVRYDSDYETHSPWELLGPDVVLDWPYVDAENQAKLVSLFDKLERSTRHQDRYGFQKLSHVAQKPDFYNRFTVPISPEVIQLRLNNSYYRTLEAVKHDIRVMLENARTYFGNSELSAKMNRLTDWFAKKMSKIRDA